ncbi:MAG TPA: hypothetical protein VMG38_19610 [Trebonia sp.]|nr:hypothetical protein [Trebonia sp.]
MPAVADGVALPGALLPAVADGVLCPVAALGARVLPAWLLAVRLGVATGVPGPADGKGEVAGADGMTLTTGMAAATPAFLSTTFAPNDATKTAITVPATQAVRPTTTRIMSAI